MGPHPTTSSCAFRLALVALALSACGSPLSGESPPPPAPPPAAWPDPSYPQSGSGGVAPSAPEPQAPADAAAPAPADPTPAAPPSDAAAPADSAPSPPDAGPAPLPPFPLSQVRAAEARLYARFATHVEGPTFRDGEIFLAADGAGFGLMRIAADRKVTRYHPMLKPVGSYLLADGSILLCDHELVLVQMFRDGKVAVLTTDHQGQAIEFCNDVTVDAPGNIYITARHTGFIYRISPLGEVVRVAGGLDLPNGLEVDPESKHLYFAAGGMMRRLALPASGGDFGRPETLPGTPSIDGMQFDVWGNLWMAQYGSGLHIYDPVKRTIIARVGAGGNNATNLTLAPDGSVFTTVAGSGVYRIGPVPGLRGFLHPGAPRYAIKRMLDLMPAN
jgi:sugar lactone lactonase YvrE